MITWYHIGSPNSLLLWGLWVYREWNENIPPHERYHWYVRDRRPASMSMNDINGQEKIPPLSTTWLSRNRFQVHHDKGHESDQQLFIDLQNHRIERHFTKSTNSTNNKEDVPMFRCKTTSWYQDCSCEHEINMK